MNHFYRLSHYPIDHFHHGFIVFVVLDRYTDILQHFVTTHIILAPLLLILAEEMGIPLIVSGDTIIGYVGYSVARTHQATLLEAFILTLISVVIGATILFFVSRRWGQQLLLKLGRYMFIKEKHIKRSEELFAKFGPLGIIIGRYIPGLRIATTVFAATSGISYPVFLISLIISSSAWIWFFLFLGNHYAHLIHQLTYRFVRISLIFTILVIAAIVAFHVYGIYNRRHKSTNVKK